MARERDFDELDPGPSAEEHQRVTVGDEPLPHELKTHPRAWLVIGLAALVSVIGVVALALLT